MAKSVTIDFNANLAKFEAGITKATNRLDKFQRDSKRQSSSMSRAFSSLGVKIAGVFGGFAIGSSILQVNRDFQKLEASLVSVTGSAEGAKRAFDLIENFASTTPYSVQELTTAFTKLTALGLKPSEKALTSYGNTASAMGKSLDQFIEAVADSVTGEFERLKEFGIKARSEGDKVAFTFQGITKTVKKNATEIEGYLREIGDVQFAGSMERQANTLDGAFSNLGDAVDRLYRRIGDAGLNSAIQSITRSISNLITATESAKGADKFNQMFARSKELAEQIAERVSYIENTKGPEWAKSDLKDELQAWRDELAGIQKQLREMQDVNVKNITEGFKDGDASGTVSAIESMRTALKKANSAGTEFAETLKLFKEGSAKPFSDAATTDSAKISQTYGKIGKALSDSRKGKDATGSIEKAAAAINKLKEGGIVAEQTIKNMKRSLATVLDNKEKPEIKIKTSIDENGLLTATDEATQKAMEHAKKNPLIIPVVLDVTSVNQQVSSIKDSGGDIVTDSQKTGGL